MSYSAVSTLYDTQVLLNDQRGTTYPFAKLLPFLQMAYRDLAERLQLSESAVVLETAGPVTVTAGDTTLTNQPTDIVLPLYMEERSVGETLYIPMDQKLWETNYAIGAFLNVWAWREERIVFAGATSTRQVQFIYLKSLSELDDQNSAIVVSNARNFLAAKTAQYAEAFIKQNFKKSEKLEMMAEASAERLLRIATKGEQAMPVRKLPYGTSRRLLGKFGRWGR